MASKAWVLAGRELRGRRSSRIGVALVVALGGGAALGSAIAAHRTDHAYHDYVERADVSDLTINPGVWSTDMDRAMRELDGVRSVRAHTMFVATAAWTGPTTVDHPPAEDYWVLMSGSTEGSFLEADRPVVTDGRLPFGTREMFVGNGYRHTLEQIVGRELDVGDVVDLGFWWSLLFDRPVAPGTVVSPISVEPVTISGFGRFPDEVLPDDLFPQQQVVLSPDLAARHSCIAPLSTSMTLEEVDEATAPRTCSSQYWFYSLDLEPGVTEQDIRDQFATVADRLNLEELPTALRDIGATHFYIGQARSDVDEAVRRTTRPAVTALVLFAIVSAAVTASILALMAVRAVRRAHGGHSTLRVLGATRRQRVTWSVLPLLQAAGLGVVGAGAVAAALSPIGPLGAVRSVQAGWSVSMPGVVMIPGLVLITVAAAVVIVAAGAYASRAATTTATLAAPAAGGRAIARGGPEARAGLAAVVGTGRGGADVAVLAGCVVAIACGAAAIVFGAGLTKLVGEPRSYGWPWDVAVVTGGGYGSADLAVVEAALDRPGVRDDVADASYFAFEPSAFLGERSAPVVFGFPNASDTDLPILDGRAARRPGEAVIGADTASRLDLSVGDRVTITSTSFDPVDARVVGIAVMPAAGHFGAERPGLGTGAFVLVDAPPAELVGMVGLRLADDVDPTSLVAELGDLSSWDLQGAPIVHASPVRSPQIANASDLRSVPLVLGGVLVIGLGLGLGLSIVSSVRGRSRELAILRVLGFTDRQVQASVRWQAAAVVSVGLVVGTPLGVVAGRFAWHRFADDLGVGRTASLAPRWLGLYLVVVAVLAFVASAPAVRRAGRSTVARVLRED